MEWMCLIATSGLYSLGKQKARSGQQNAVLYIPPPPLDVGRRNCNIRCDGETSSIDGRKEGSPQVDAKHMQPPAFSFV